MDNHHHHHHHHHDMTTPTPESTTDPMTPVNDVMSSHQHHQHHQHHMMTFHTWAASKLLVEQWSIDSVHGLVLAILFSAFLSIVYEGSKFYYHIGKILVVRNKLVRRQGTLLYHYISRLWKSLAFMIHFFVGYVLMLCAMTFNIWVLTAVCLGSGIGYFFLLPTVQYVVQRDMDTRAHVSQGSGTPLGVEELCPTHRARAKLDSEAGSEEGEGGALLETRAEVTSGADRETVV